MADVVIDGVKVDESALLDEVLASSEIRELFPGMASQTVRSACVRGALICRRAGRDWIILKSSAIEYFNRPAKSGRPSWRE